MKKISALVLIFIMMFSSLTVFAEGAEGNSDKADIKTLAVLGDSISTGFGLDGYESGTQNSEISSYANLTAKNYGLINGENYFNYSLDGTTSNELLEALNGGFDEEKLSFVKNADTIVFTVGANDILAFILPELSEMLGLSENASFIEMITTLVTINGESLNLFNESAKGFCNDRKEELSELYSAYAQNLDNIGKKLKEIAPNAQIFVLNIYDPLRDMPAYQTVSVLDANVVSVIISEMNKRLLEACNANRLHAVDIASEFSGRRYACTNVAKLDIHPNKQGHTIAADALCLNIDRVYKELSVGSTPIFKEPKYIWLWFAGAVAVVILATGVVVFVIKKSAK